jgi:hypothetical protein
MAGALLGQTERTTFLGDVLSHRNSRARLVKATMIWDGLALCYWRRAKSSPARSSNLGPRPTNQPHARRIFAPRVRGMPQSGMSIQRAPRPSTDAILLERCRVAGRQARAAGVRRQDNPFDVLVRTGDATSVPSEIWRQRSHAWLEGWDLASAGNAEKAAGHAAEMVREYFRRKASP